MEPFPGCSSFELLEPEVKVEQAAANETLFRQGLGAADSGWSLSSETRSWGPSGPDANGSIERDVENRRSSVSSAPSSSATSTVQHFPGHRYSVQPDAAPRRGEARYLPCVACVRKLANNPSWVCHDTISVFSKRIPSSEK